MFNLSTLEIFEAAWASDLKASRLIEPNALIRNGPQSQSKLNQWANPLLWIDDFFIYIPVGASAWRPMDCAPGDQLLPWPPLQPHELERTSTLLHWQLVDFLRGDE